MRNPYRVLKAFYIESKEEWGELPSRTRISFILFGFAGFAMLLVMLAQPLFLQNHHEFNTNLAIPDAYNSSVTYNANIVMSTTVFAVDVPIYVKATIQPNNNITTRYVYVLFEGSHDYPPRKTGFADSLYSGKINAQPQSNNLYAGNTTLSYDMDGCFDVKITAYLQSQSTLPINQTRSCNFIHIQSSEAANADFYTRYLIILGVGTVIFSYCGYRYLW